MSVKSDLEVFWYDFITQYTNYMCILKCVDLDDEDTNYPLIRYDILEVNKLGEGMLYTRKKLSDKIEESFDFKATYILDFDLYFKGEYIIDIDNLINTLNNPVLMSRFLHKYDYSKMEFKDLVTRGPVEEKPRIDIFGEQTVGRNNYQLNFVVDIITKNDVGLSKTGTITEEVWNEIN